MSKKRFIPALGAFFVLALGVAGCGSGIPGNDVANVAGNPITLDAYKHWMVVAAKFQAAQTGGPVIVANDPPNFPSCIQTIRTEISQLKKASTKELRGDCNQLFKSYSSQVMHFLITAYWYQAEAAREHIKITDAQVQKSYNSAIKQSFPSNAQFQAFLNETSETPQDVLYRFRIQQVYSKLLAKQNTTVTQAQIQTYYNSHKAQFGTPESRSIRIVLTKTKADAQKAQAALASGKGWDAVAKQYSIDSASKDKGGLLENVTQGSQDTALDSAAFSAPKGKVVGPVQGQYGWYILEVAQIKPGTQQSLAQASPLIRQTLTTQAQNNATSTVDKTLSKHWKGQTQCRSTYATADCTDYKAPKSSTSTTPSATTTG